MFSKSKKPENKDMVVAPVPIPPKETNPDLSRKEATGLPTEDKVFTKVPPSVFFCVGISSDR